MISIKGLGIVSIILGLFFLYNKDFPLAPFLIILGLIIIFFEIIIYFLRGFRKVKKPPKWIFGEIYKTRWEKGGIGSFRTLKGKHYIYQVYLKGYKFNEPQFSIYRKKR